MPFMMHEEFERAYRERLEKIELPEILQNHIRCIGCLKERRNICTLLVTDGSRKYVLKIAKGRRIACLECEKTILEELEKAGVDMFPSPKFAMMEDGVFYYMREYVEGETLLTTVKKHGCMGEKCLVNTAIHLCNLLEVLHSQEPPVIHRDIKPENIVCKEDHTFIFIDFETAVRLVPEKNNDTVRMGSRLIAAPEQVARAEADCRTDIYGIGMTLLYLACGSYDKKDLRTSGLSLYMQRMIRKCLAYNPDRRYRTAAEFREKLLRYKRLSVYLKWKHLRQLNENSVLQLQNKKQ